MKPGTAGYTAVEGDIALIWVKASDNVTRPGRMFVYPAYSTDNGTLWSTISTGGTGEGPVANSTQAPASTLFNYYGMATKTGWFPLAPGSTYSFSCAIAVTLESPVEISPSCEVLVLVHKI